MKKYLSLLLVISSLYYPLASMAECAPYAIYPYNRISVNTTVGQQVYLPLNNITATIVSYPVYDPYKDIWYEIKYPGIKNGYGNYEIVPGIRMVLSASQPIENNTYACFVIDFNGYEADYLIGDMASADVLYQEDNMIKIVSSPYPQIRIPLGNLRMTFYMSSVNFSDYPYLTSPSTWPDLANDKDLQSKIKDMYPITLNYLQKYFEIFNYISISQMD